MNFLFPSLQQFLTLSTQRSTYATVFATVVTATYRHQIYRHV